MASPETLEGSDFSGCAHKIPGQGSDWSSLAHVMLPGQSQWPGSWHTVIGLVWIMFSFKEGDGAVDNRTAQPEPHAPRR